VKFIMYKDYNKAYRSISFEREAYDNEEQYGYVEKRKMYNWIKLL